MWTCFHMKGVIYWKVQSLKGDVVRTRYRRLTDTGAPEAVSCGKYRLADNSPMAILIYSTYHRQLLCKYLSMCCPSASGLRQ